jgi:hypothetical protein
VVPPTIYVLWAAKTLLHLVVAGSSGQAPTKLLLDAGIQRGGGYVLSCAISPSLLAGEGGGEETLEPAMGDCFKNSKLIIVAHARRFSEHLLTGKDQRKPAAQ